MSFTFGAAIYFIMWWLTLFAVLPFGLKTQEEAGDVVPGTPESAPARPRLMRIFFMNTVVATVAFVLFWLGVTQGWLSPETFPFQIQVQENSRP